jgi:hypothetical protein
MQVAEMLEPVVAGRPPEIDAARPVRRNRFLREPLVHFLVLGALLFLYFQWSSGGSGSGSNRIVVSHGQVEHLASGFAGTWQRPPTEAELKGLIDDYVQEEMAVREAARMGLDRDDTIIRRRLRQKFEFLAEDAITAAPPTDAELQAWMTKHPGSFRSELKLAFRQVYINTGRRGASARADAEKLLTRLRTAGPNASIDNLGDSSMLPSEQKLAPLFETVRTFGDGFAQELTKVEPGQWAGPIESSYGFHLVLVRERVAASQLTLSEIRPHVEREVLAGRRKNELQALYDRLLKDYVVTGQKEVATK